MKVAFVFIAAAIVLTGCSSNGKPRLFSRLTGSSSEVAVSALAFQSNDKFGQDLTSQERRQLSLAEKKALEYGAAGEEIGWKSQSAPVSGTILASRPFRVGGSNCRRFEHRLVRKDKNETAYGTACQRDGGPWRLVQ